MNSADPTFRTGPTGAGTSQIRGRLIRFVAAGLVLCVIGGFWYRARRAAIGQHWDEVAKGRAYLAARRPDLALGAVSGVRDAAPGAGEAMTVAGLALIGLGQYPSARLAFERALTLEPNQFETAVTLAELNVDLGNGHRGVELFARAARLRPDVFRVWLTMGKVLSDLDDKPGAIRAYEQALALKPGDRESTIGLIECLMANRQSELAEPWVTEALRTFPDDAVILGLASRVAYDVHRLDESITLAGRALAVDPRNVTARLARGRVHVVRGHWKEALPDAEQAVAVEPNDRAALQLLAQIETWLGLSERATATRARLSLAQERIELMDRLAQEIRLAPEDPRLPWRMGRTALEAGSLLLARRCFEAAAALDPNFEPARASLAALRGTDSRQTSPMSISTLEPASRRQSARSDRGISIAGKKQRLP